MTMTVEPRHLSLYVIEYDEALSHNYEQMTIPGSVKLAGLAIAPDSFPMHEVLRQRPDVLLVSGNKVEAGLLCNLRQIYRQFEDIGLVLLFNSCDSQDVRALRALVFRGRGGIAVLLRRSMGRTEQLSGLIEATSRGHIIFDPTLLELISNRNPGCRFLEVLTPKELETLSLLANGYTNTAISRKLFIDVKTVEHHLNNVYSKLKAGGNFGDKHLRVEVARLYFREAGGLVAI